MFRRLFNRLLWLFIHRIPWKPLLIWGPTFIATITTAFFLFENWRGNQAWKQAQTHANSLGLYLNYRNFTPSPNKHSPNLSSLPGFDGRNFKGFKKRLANFQPHLNPIGIKAYQSGARWQAKPRDIRAWLDPADPSASSHKLAALRLDELTFAQTQWLHELKTKIQHQPLVLPPDSLEFHPNSYPGSNITKTLQIADALRDDTSIALALQDHQRALTNIDTLFRLADTQAYHCFMTQLVSTTILHIATDAIWEFTLLANPTPAQLTHRHTRHAQPHHALHVTQSVSGEMCYALQVLDAADAKPNLIHDLLAFSGNSPATHLATGTPWLDTALKDLELLFHKLSPGGWLDLARAETVESHLQLTQMTSHSLSELQKTARSGFDSWRYLPGNLARSWNNPFVDKFLSHLIEIETRIQLTRIGLDLESFRLRHQRYPHLLAELPHTYPDDLWSGQPYQYRLKPDGSPLVWSVGENQVDENGLPSPANNRQEGDLTWHLTPFPNLTPTKLEKLLAPHRLK
ncbi:MAG: hypothetical protein AAGC74_08105 [Verrucomicrobiota bacterium]